MPHPLNGQFNKLIRTRLYHFQNKNQFDKQVLNLWTKISAMNRLLAKKMAIDIIVNKKVAVS